MNKLATRMPHHSRLVKCPKCKKYVFLTTENKFSKHYKNIYKNIICGGSNLMFEIELYVILERGLKNVKRCSDKDN